MSNAGVSMSGARTVDNVMKAGASAGAGAYGVGNVMEAGAGAGVGAYGVSVSMEDGSGARTVGDALRQERYGA